MIYKQQRHLSSLLIYIIFTASSRQKIIYIYKLKELITKRGETKANFGARAELPPLHQSRPVSKAGPIPTPLKRNVDVFISLSTTHYTIQ